MKLLILWMAVISSLHIVSAQNTMYTGSWVRTNAVNIDSTQHLNPFDPQVYFYSRIDFISKDQLVFSNSPYDVSKPVNYKYSASQLEFNFTRYEVSYRSDTLLVLSEVSNLVDTKMAKKRFSFYEENYLLEKFRDDHGDVHRLNQDTLNLKPINVKQAGLMTMFYYNPQIHFNKIHNYKIMPRFKHSSENFETYFQKEMKNKVFNDAGENFTIAIDISEKGKILSVRSLQTDNELISNELMKIFKRSSAYWKPAVINGQKSPVTMIYPIVIDRRVRDREKAVELFRMGNDMLGKNQFKSAIEHLTSALNYEPSYTEAYYNRALAYFSIDDIENACHDWIKIYQSGEMGTYEYLKQFCGFE